MGEVLQFKTVTKVDESLGLVFGWGIVCTKNGEDYYDLQGDHIPDPVMLPASTNFMIDGRVAKDMHTGEQIGLIVHSMPLTKEIAKAYDITCPISGWMVAMRPDNKTVLKAFSEGTRTGFSIGGMCSYDLEEAA